MAGKLSEQPSASAGTEADLHYVVQSGQSRKQTRTQLRTAIMSGWQAFIGTFLVAATPADARTAIGVIIGTDVQAYDPDLSAVAGVSTSGLLARTGSGTAAARTLTGTAGKVTVTDGNGVSGDPTITLPDALSLVNPSVSTLLTLTGGQAKFPSTQVPSADPNTLDDYEEGTFMPTITFSTPGDLNVVYSVQDGSYTKVGRLVQWRATIATTTFTHSTASGGLQIAGLPFTSISNPPATLSQWVGVTSAVTTPQIVATLNNALVNLSVMNVSAGTIASLTTANAPSGVQKTISIGGTFTV